MIGRQTSFRASRRDASFTPQSCGEIKPTRGEPDGFVRKHLWPERVEDSMDRRQFGKLALSAGAATAGAGEATVALAQTPAASASDAIKLPPELRAIFEQDYPRFYDAEYSRRRDVLAGVMEAAGVAHLLIVSALNVGNATRWVTG